MDQVATRRNILALAIVLGLLAALLIGVYLKNAGTGMGQATGDVSVVTATQPISANMVIEAEMIAERKAPRSDVEGGVATSEADVVGKVATTDFARDQRIQASQVMPKSVLGLAGTVPIGMRAVTVALDPIIGVGGFLKPGNHVDVVATFNVNEGSVTKTVLQDQVLLATGSQLLTSSVDASGKASRSETLPNATLSVDPIDAEKLILAESKGKLRLTLRSQGDIVRVASRGITSRSLIGYVPPDVSKQASYAPPAAPRIMYGPTRVPINPFYGSAPALPATMMNLQPSREIEVIRGSQVERFPVKM
jgi:pilus assembly protein CpaB